VKELKVKHKIRSRRQQFTTQTRVDKQKLTESELERLLLDL